MHEDVLIMHYFFPTDHTMKFVVSSKRPPLPSSLAFAPISASVSRWYAQNSPS